MNYIQAMIDISSGNVVRLDGEIYYMSADFASGMAGKIVCLQSGLEIEYTASLDDISRSDWERVPVD